MVTVLLDECDVTHMMWELVDAVNSNGAESCLDTPVHVWWKQNGDRCSVWMDDTRLLCDSGNVSRTFNEFGCALETAGDSRLAEFRRAYNYICTWCETSDIADIMANVSIDSWSNATRNKT